jgi:hypothetical protein
MPFNFDCLNTSDGKDSKGASRPHRGEWRDCVPGRPTSRSYCCVIVGTVSQNDGLMCTHGPLACNRAFSHWSCCGSTEEQSTHCATSRQPPQPGASKRRDSFERTKHGSENSNDSDEISPRQHRFRGSSVRQIGDHLSLLSQQLHQQHEQLNQLTGSEAASAPSVPHSTLRRLSDYQVGTRVVVPAPALRHRGKLYTNVAVVWLL